MGTERALGSPFQIDFPPPADLFFPSLDEQHPSPSPGGNTTVPFHDVPLSCNSDDINARCACPDCPSVCAVLPPIRSPRERDETRCKVGKMSCFAFSLTILYAVTLVAFTVLLAISEVWARKGAKGSQPEDEENGWTRLRNRLSFASGWTTSRDGDSHSGYDQLPLEDPLAADYDESPVPIGGRGRRSPSRGNTLIGAASTANALDGEEPRSTRSSARTTSSPHNSSTTNNSHRLSQGASLLAPEQFNSTSPFLQPRTYPLNTALSSFFYRLGLFCARSPWLTLALGCVVCGLINLGWSRFEVEKDPVKLWVAKGSEAARAKEAFEEGFGPFYRTEQFFLSVAPNAHSAQLTPDEDSTNLAARGRPRWAPVDAPVLTFPVLQFLARIEASIRSLKSSPNGYTLSDVCFSPSTDPEAPDDVSSCIVQSPMGYFSDTLGGVSEDTWAERLNQCATTPAACLPPSGQPLNVKLVLGGVPEPAAAGDLLRADQARAVVVTYVVRNSLDPEVVARAEEWEASLKTFLGELSGPASEADALGLEVAWSTGLSLEQELSASANTDVPIVVLSYVFM